jgi:hypothetical protein
VRPKANEVEASYKFEGHSIQLEIHLPADYPLSPAKIQRDERAMLDKRMNRRWMLQLEMWTRHRLKTQVANRLSSTSTTERKDFNSRKRRREISAVFVSGVRGILSVDRYQGFLRDRSLCTISRVNRTRLE